MSHELETLDQLLSGEKPLRVVRQVYPNADRFIQGMCGLLAGGEVMLVVAGDEVPQWQWRTVLATDPLPSDASVSLTPAGARRIN